LVIEMAMDWKIWLANGGDISHPVGGISWVSIAVYFVLPLRVDKFIRRIDVT
jgi:hypothetical protein